LGVALVVFVAASCGLIVSAMPSAGQDISATPNAKNNAVILICEPPVELNEKEITHGKGLWQTR
jgi:hypothetical protein